MSFFGNLYDNWYNSVSINNPMSYLSPPLNFANVLIGTMAQGAVNPAPTPTNYQPTNTNQPSPYVYAAGGVGVGALLALGLAAFVLIKK